MLVATLCLSLGITCFLSCTSSKAQHLTNRLIRVVIIPHVAFDAIPSSVPVTALPSCFSFVRRWHILPVAESACFVSNFQIVTQVTTCLALCPLFLKPCVRYACRFSCFGWICWTCSGGLLCVLGFRCPALLALALGFRCLALPLPVPSPCVSGDLLRGLGLRYPPLLISSQALRFSGCLRGLGLRYPPLWLCRCGACRLACGRRGSCSKACGR